MNYDLDLQDTLRYAVIKNLRDTADAIEYGLDTGTTQPCTLNARARVLDSAAEVVRLVVDLQRHRDADAAH